MTEHELQAALALQERNTEREMSKLVRRHLLTEPGLKEAMIASVVNRMRDELDLDEEWQDTERRLWAEGDCDREH